MADLVKIWRANLTAIKEMQKAFDEKKDGAKVRVESAVLLKCISLVDTTLFASSFCQPKLEDLVKTDAAAPDANPMRAMMTDMHEPETVNVALEKADRLKELINLSQ